MNQCFEGKEFPNILIRQDRKGQRETGTFPHKQNARVILVINKWEKEERSEKSGEIKVWKKTSGDTKIRKKSHLGSRPEDLALHDNWILKDQLNDPHQLLSLLSCCPSVMVSWYYVSLLLTCYDYKDNTLTQSRILVLVILCHHGYYHKACKEETSSFHLMPLKAKERMNA
jgi:hypothetical protein